METTNYIQCTGSRCTMKVTRKYTGTETSLWRREEECWMLFFIIVCLKLSSDLITGECRKVGYMLLCSTCFWLLWLLITCIPDKVWIMSKRTSLYFPELNDWDKCLKEITAYSSVKAGAFLWGFSCKNEAAEPVCILPSFLLDSQSDGPSSVWGVG